MAAALYMSLCGARLGDDVKALLCVYTHARGSRRGKVHSSAGLVEWSFDGATSAAAGMQFAVANIAGPER